MPHRESIVKDIKQKPASADTQVVGATPLGLVGMPQLPNKRQGNLHAQTRPMWAQVKNTKRLPPPPFAFSAQTLMCVYFRRLTPFLQGL